MRQVQMAGKSVIVTGAGGRVGEACARRFAADGAKLTIADKDGDHVRQLSADLRSEDVEANCVAADVANRLDVHNIVAEALDAYGRIDVLAHCATEFLAKDFLETNEDDFESLVAANLRGAFLLNQAVSKQFAKQFEEESGDVEAAIVNVTSIEAITAHPDHVAFAATQGGLSQLTKAVALAVSPYGARANAVGVGLAQFQIDEVDRKEAREAAPLGRVADPKEIAEAIFFLASPAASYITAHTIYVDGGSLVRAQRPVAKK